MHSSKIGALKPVKTWLSRGILVTAKKHFFGLAAITTWLVTIYYWLGLYGKYEEHVEYEAMKSPVHANAKVADDSSLDKFPIVNLYMVASEIKDSRGVDSHSNVYNQMFANHDINSLLASLTFEERCDLYFDTLFSQDINWNIDLGIDFQGGDRWAFDFGRFKLDKKDAAKKKVAEEKKIDESKVEEKDLDDKLKHMHDEFLEKMRKDEQKMTDIISHVRIFNKCYITSDNAIVLNRNREFASHQSNWMKQLSLVGIINAKSNERSLLRNAKALESCSALESRVYRWLSFSYPVYERWTGETLLTPPKMSDYIKDEVVFTPTNSKAQHGRGASNLKKSKVRGNNGNKCFLQNFKNKLNAKGLVLSIADKHVDSTIKLIHLLRALNNRYPIQIVYYSSLSEESKRRIVEAARSRFTDLPGSFSNVAHLFPNDYFDPKGKGLPMQEVWFVSVYNTIQDHYRSEFNGFGNKYLAALFNSFEEYILLDADTVMLKPPEYFFNTDAYKKKGAFFFKDRTSTLFRPESDATFFKKMSPSIIDQVFFDIPILTNHTLSSPFFDGMEYMMESGLVCIDRNLHFNSILMMFQLNFLKPARQRVYGDKEIFWLGFAIDGDESYEFNKFPAAAIGSETPQEERLTSSGKPKYSRELCSAHPGHINGEDGKTLLWFNSGFQFCGEAERVNYEEEFSNKERLKYLSSVDEMKSLYWSKLHIKQAIIPPFEDKWHTLCENIQEEPKEGWKMDRGYCRSYLWCAYSSIGGFGKDGSDNTQVGYFINFDKDQIDLIEYYGDIWIGNE